MTKRRPVAFAQYAELTRALRVAAEANDLGQASRLLDARQRLSDEQRTLDGGDGPLSEEERAILDGARADEAATSVVLETERHRFIQLFQDVARSRRAHGGYASLAVRAAATTERTA